MTGVTPEDLLARFTDPRPEYGPLPIWWWSGAKVTRERLRWQMERLVAGGVRQAVVLCLAPTGPMFGSVADDPPFLSPEWLELFDQACADAAELGFTLWMYDQIGFSGANLQGRLIAAEPGFAGSALFRTRGSGTDVTLRPPPGHTALAAYAIAGGVRVDVPIVDGVAEWAGAPAEVTVVHAGRSGFDYFDEQACAALLDQVHGTLERAVGRWFGSSIGGFFQDELPPMPTWGRDFASTFAERYGYDLLPRLWALWEPDGSPEAAAVRRDYHEHRATLARRGFFDQHDSWFAERGLTCGFDQASPAREGDPIGGVRTYGDYLGLHAGYGAPGSDHWGDAKVHSSLAHANGHERVWIEAFHSSGWGGTLEETYDWLSAFLRRGATLYDPHAVYYATVGGWWEWAPPSTCWRQPYWPSYDVFATAVARVCSMLTAGRHVCDVALLSPTSTAQAHLTLAGPLPPAVLAERTFRELNGVNSWLTERRGVLESAGIDHDALDEATIARGTVVDGGLRIADETYRTVVVPSVSILLPAAAERLAELAAAGGRVVVVGAVPDALAGVAGLVAVDAAAAVPDAVLRGPVQVSADAPFVLRAAGSAHVVALMAHDGQSGTVAPILDFEGSWVDSGFDWQEYNDRLRTTGYRFVPPRGRTATVRVTGIERPRAQSWSPGSGRRTELAVVASDGGWTVEVPFDDGAVALLVLAEHLPEPTAQPLGPVTETVAVVGPWTGLAESTLDNRWGDLAAADRTGTLPIEVWQLEHAVAGGWAPVTAGFGPFAQVRHGGGEWEPAEWSLSRGIRNDPVHAETLGPKGVVPEEFLDRRAVAAGDRLDVRTHLELPDVDGLALMVGAGAARRVRAGGIELAVVGEGHQSFSPLPRELGGRTVLVEIELTAERDGPLRAGFAVVTDVEAARRPEWLRPGGPAVPGDAGEVTVDVELAAIPADAEIQVGSNGSCAVVVNGVEVGLQGDFNPYPEHREIRVHSNDVGTHLRAGSNMITLRLTEHGGDPTAATLDSAGLGLVSGSAGWRATRDGRPVPLVARRWHGGDPRFVCQRPRSHPLPGAAWLDPAVASGGVVLPLVPDIAPGGPRTETLRMLAPPGTVGLRIPTALDVVVEVGGAEHKPDAGGRVRFAAPVRGPVLLRFAAAGGRRAGALLDGPVEVEVVAAEMPLVPWAELGLRALGGQVTYTTSVQVEPGGRTVLDLGEVRGTADVSVNGVLADRLVWGPWRTEITGLLRPGANTIEVVVRGTLAGYLDDASPTSGVYAGQVRTGLLGPVTLHTH